MVASPNERDVIQQMVAMDVEREGCTIAGWYWYCDACDTHGNADSEPEAWWTGRAHEDYQRSIQLGDECCDLFVWRVAGGDRT